MTTIRTRISGDYIKASCNTFNSCTTSCRTVNSQNCYRGRPHVFNLFTNYASPYNSTWSSSRPRAIPSYAPGIETSDGSLKDLAGGIIAVGAITELQSLSLLHQVFAIQKRFAKESGLAFNNAI